MASRVDCCYLHGETEPKPQFSFKQILADNSSSPFQHIESSSTEHSHPFAKEINALIDNPPPIEFSSFTNEDRPKESYTWVSSRLQLVNLAIKLAKQQVFAVDTEQHSLRSYLGFTALIQISTREEDYLVDAIVLHDEMHHLRPVFSDHRICKVFHGARNDVFWLQRDFHIYVVNLFDTYTACVKLEKSKNSLAYLLDSICKVTTDKSLRLGDWRERPLSDDMLQYARKDTQYLLSIADSLIAELRGRGDNFVEDVTKDSNRTCLRLYPKEEKKLNLVKGYEPDSHQLVWKLCSWRDLMARIHDESRSFVLSDMAILNLARIKPTTQDAILKVIIGAEKKEESDIESIMFRCHIDAHFVLMISDNSKSLGTSGTCPANPFNHSILKNFKVNPLCPPMNGGKQTPKASSISKHGNVDVYDGDGNFKFCCNRKKLDRFSRMKIAEEVPRKNAIIVKNEDIGCLEKEKNQCVRCGDEISGLIRHRLIPLSYRKYFPEKLNQNKSRDIVFLCQRECQQLANRAAKEFEKVISSRYEASSSSDQTTMDTKECECIRGAAAALLKESKSEKKMSETRRAEFTKTVETYYGRENLLEEDLQRAAAIGLNKRGKHETNKEKKIIEDLLNNFGEDGVKRFCEDWRKQFVSELQPKYYFSSDCDRAEDGLAAAEDEDQLRAE